MWAALVWRWGARLAQWQHQLFGFLFKNWFMDSIFSLHPPPHSTPEARLQWCMLLTTSVQNYFVPINHLLSVAVKPHDHATGDAVSWEDCSDPDRPGPYPSGFVFPACQVNGYCRGFRSCILSSSVTSCVVKTEFVQLAWVKCYTGLWTSSWGLTSHQPHRATSGQLHRKVHLKCVFTDLQLKVHLKCVFTMIYTGKYI